MSQGSALITNDAVVLGMLSLILGAVFWTHQSRHPFWVKFYSVVPVLLLCYFLPSLLNTFGIVDGARSNVYYVCSRYLLPACLVMLILTVDLPSVLKLGPRALAMFLTGTLGIVIGGPLAILIVSTFSPETVGGAGPDAVWRGMTTIAGSWIGGSPNQTAMKEVFEVGDAVFSQMVTVDVICGSIWLAFLLFASSRAGSIDRYTGADTSAIEALKQKVEQFHAEHARIPRLQDLIYLLAIGFGVTGAAHAVADVLAPWLRDHAPGLDRLSLTSEFFWIVVIATTAGLALSFTRARQLEGAGASTVASAFVYLIVAAVGMKMDVTAIAENPGLFGVGMIWIGIHAALMVIVAWLIRAPLFYVAVGSQANIGGAASAPLVASVFHPSLAPVGVLLAVLGYAVGTYAAWLCGQLMRIAAGSP